MVTIQEQLHDNFCWGCGADNPDGLHLRSEWEGDGAIGWWTPSPEFAAGPRHFLNGGIIATLLDCHGVCTALAEAHRRAGRPLGSEPQIWLATSAMDVRYLRPTPIDADVVLRGTVRDVTDTATSVECVLEAAGKARARAVVTSVQVPESWRHGSLG